ncbi:hypothetical protein DL93DRAFT_2084650 [Clavulina sp. PMI_390]|nr:hypothetical protein DL93DRAFT_2084650 [Clavulina sp. PMI_390]
MHLIRRSLALLSLPSSSGRPSPEPSLHSPLSQLPTDIHFAIIDALFEGQSRCPSSILQLCLVNRYFQGIIVPRIWRTFVIGAGKKCDGRPKTETQRMKKAVQQRCDVLLKDIQRAKLIHTLVIEVSAPALTRPTLIERALMAVPNLHTLRIESRSGREVLPESLANVAAMLVKGSFPFNLLEFQCEPSLLFAAQSGVFQFLFAQSAIRVITISAISPGPSARAAGWWPEAPNPYNSTPKEGGPGALEFLPKLRRFRGPTVFARPFLHYRSQTTGPPDIDAVDLILQHTTYDFHCFEQALRSSPHPPFPRNNSSLTRATSLPRADSFSLWIDNHDKSIDVAPYISSPQPSHVHIPALLPYMHGIDPAHTRSLVVGYRNCIVAVYQWPETFPVELLTHFEQLESLEVKCGDVSAMFHALGSPGSSGRAAPGGIKLERKAAMIVFLQKCEALCRMLRTVRFVEHDRRVLELVQVYHPSFTSNTPSPPGIGAEEEVAQCMYPFLPGERVLQLRSGSAWTVIGP